MKVLLLAGTAEARELADIARWCNDIEMIASLRGADSSTRRPPVPGSGRWLRRRRWPGGVPAGTRHRRDRRRDPPLREGHAASCAGRGTRRPCTAHARLVRPPWTRTDQDRWIDAEDLADAARAVARLGVSPVLLTIGRLDLAAFAGLEPVAFVVRTVESPESLPFRPVAIVRGGGRSLSTMKRNSSSDHGVELVVTKNAGGSDAKLVAARAARLPVVMVRRPPTLPSVPSQHTDALAWLTSLVA